MNKEMLIKLMQERDLTYPQFLQQIQENTVSTRWGMGIGEPYSLEPYRMELVGIKPGRMLKKPSKPAPNRYCYSYDKEGRVIHKVEHIGFGGPPGNKSWMHSDDFYEYGDGHVIRYVFGSFLTEEEAKLDGIIWANVGDKKVHKTFRLNKWQCEYTEVSYSYDGGNVIGIRIQWPEGPYPDRVLKVLHESGDTVRILDISREEIQIYPE
jgi:hypothetical protein